jgi:hypothetical protein
LDLRAIAQIETFSLEASYWVPLSAIVVRWAEKEKRRDEKHWILQRSRHRLQGLRLPLFLLVSGNVSFSIRFVISRCGRKIIIVSWPVDDHQVQVRKHNEEYENERDVKWTFHQYNPFRYLFCKLFHSTDQGRRAAEINSLHARLTIHYGLLHGSHNTSGFIVLQSGNP